jgi:chromosome segregation ATPase
MSSTNETNKMMEKILEELASMKAKLPNGELKVIQTTINELKNSQDSMKSDLSEMKKRLSQKKIILTFLALFLPDLHQQDY